MRQARSANRSFAGWGALIALVILGIAVVFFLARPFWEGSEEHQEALDGTVPELPNEPEGGLTPVPVSGLLEPRGALVVLPEEVPEHSVGNGARAGEAQPLPAFETRAAYPLHVFVTPPSHPLPDRLSGFLRLIEEPARSA